MVIALSAESQCLRHELAAELGVWVDAQISSLRSLVAGGAVLRLERCVRKKRIRIRRCDDFRGAGESLLDVTNGEHGHGPGRAAPPRSPRRRRPVRPPQQKSSCLQFPVHDVQPHEPLRRVLEALGQRRHDLEAQRPPQRDRLRVRLHHRVELHRPEAVRARLLEHMRTERAADPTARVLRRRP